MAMDETSKTPKPDTQPGEAEDLVLLHGRTEDGAGFRALRSREGRVEAAELRPAKEGQPLHGAELVALHPRPKLPLLCDVEVLYRRDEQRSASAEPSVATGHAGPARVSSRSYRQNWEQVFRRPARKKSEPAN